MNIYIYNCSNTYNYGSMMMGENFIAYFNKISGQNNHYYIETQNQINIDRLIEATGFKSIQAVNLDALFIDNSSKYDYLQALNGLKEVTSDFVNKINLVVVLGGDDFTEDYGWKGPVLNLIKFNILRKKGLKVVMLGQTMGPYRSFRKPLIKNLLKKIDKIYPRDPITYEYLNNLRLKNISLTDDLALMPLSKQKMHERVNEYITYCPSELIYKYSKEGGREDWISFNLFMIDTIMHKFSDKKLVLLAHVLEPKHVDDRKIVNELYKICGDKYKDRIVLENNEMYPYEVRSYIQQSLFTISSRMHPVISSIQCEIPAIALSYSSKYWGIIGERYELKDYIIDVRYLSYDSMRELFVCLVEKIENEYKQIQQKMLEKNKLAEEGITKTLKEIVDLL